ncbi:MAG TPA: MFS transporter [Acetobacteraceae bacterium]|nr:MFS transporter [Acetobacteraceae bacterium]
MTQIAEADVMRRVAWRLVPFLGLGYYVNALDRSNIAVAALTMNHSLGFSAAQYGLGAGAFFWSYVLFQIPANMLLTRLGARRWLTVIILAWALCSGATALVTDVTSFVVVRFLLGVAEAGYFSGVIFFLTCWFPDRYRGRAMGVFYAFAAAAVSTGAPISGNILALHGWLGLQGWQWIFLLEAAPAVVLAAIAPFILRDGPSDAHWLTPDERSWLQATLDAERRQGTGRELPKFAALRSVAVFLMTIAYVLIGFGVYANVFFLPLMIKDLGYSNLVTSYLAALPAALGVLGMVVVSRSSDRTGERVWHVTLCTLVAGIGLVLAGLTVGQKLPELVSLCVVGFAISAALPTFWNLPTAYFGAGAAAAGIAMINSIGNISGYFAPQLVGVLRDATGNYSLALVVVGVMAVAAALLLPFAGAPARAAQLRRAAAG